LTVPSWVALLLRLPGVIAHSAALLRGLNDGKPMLPAKLVGSLLHKSIAGFAVVVLLAVYERNRVQDKMVVDIPRKQSGGGYAYMSRHRFTISQ